MKVSRRITMDKHCLYIFFVALVILVDAQDQSGFIMIDCGIKENSSYIDAKTGIYYVSDSSYVNTGTNSLVSNPNYDEKQYNNVRAFPEGERNCYTLVPPRVAEKARYFIRARFVYGNYDRKNRPPTFDIYLGVNYWATVNSLDAWNFEVLHASASDYTYVCLVNTGNGTPFISVLELRLVDDYIYQTISYGSLRLYGRYDLRAYSNQLSVRYPDDIYDRIWWNSFFTDAYVVEVNLTGATTQNRYKLPSVVMNTAISPRNASAPLEFDYTPSDPNAGNYFCFHFADDQSNKTREIDIYIDDLPWQMGVKLEYLRDTTVYKSYPEDPTARYTVSLYKSTLSSLPPLLNALEIYMTMDSPNLFTDNADVVAIKYLKAIYGVERNWQGDPCSPRAQLWEGLDCFNTTLVDPPRIISLNLSYSDLTEISSVILNLTVLQRLDLSFNSLTGDVPSFLTKMPKLKALNLSGNNFTGQIPATLLERAQNGSLVLSMEGNPFLCKQKSCEIKPAEKEKEIEKKTTKDGNKMLGPAALIGIGVGAVVIVLLTAFAIVWVCIRRKKGLQRTQPQLQLQQQPPPPPHVLIVKEEVPVVSNYRSGTTSFEQKDKQLSYSEILRITDNFRNELGGGGFGKVYHGYLDGNQVAVKMLSPTSVQGYKQFIAEAELLMRVHHRNLTILVGYCDEGDKLGLVYEFMANGDLQSHLSKRSTSFLPWEMRIEIAVNAAQGLEYLHSGCTPPIIHRDVKSTNILLDDKFQAKLGDFGLSKVFPTEDSTHVSTAFAGTPGYVDPEFNMNEKSDVYSFGVVLLELITGQPALPRTENKIHLGKWVSDALAIKGDIRHIVDPRMGRNFDINSMWKAVDVAMECVSATSVTRPVMNIVVMELKTCLAMEKSRTRTGYTSDSIRDSNDVSSPYMETTGFDPVAR